MIAAASKGRGGFFCSQDNPLPARTPGIVPHNVHLYDFQAFACTSCGRCCRPWEVSLEKVQRNAIEASAAYQRRLRRGYLPITVETAGIGELGDRGDGHCTFLDEKNLCELHGEIGGRSKPMGCQLYPYQVVRTPAGTFAYLSFGCPPVVAGLDFDVSANRNELREVLGDYAAPLEDSEESPFLVELSAQTSIPWQAYLRLEAELATAFQSSQPITSCLTLAANLLAWERTGKIDLERRLSPEDLEFTLELLRKFLGSMISAVENIDEDSVRRELALAVETGQSVVSERFGLTLPPLSTGEPEATWVLEVYSRYYRNALVGKAALRSTLIARLYTMACELILTSYYAEAFRLDRGLTVLDLDCLTDAFGIVEFHHGIHSPAMGRFGLALEETFRTLT